MNAVTLRRTDAARNMHRYYRLDVQPDLFEQWCCVREWGRIGTAGQMRSFPYPMSMPIEYSPKVPTENSSLRCGSIAAVATRRLDIGEGIKIEIDNGL